MKKILIVIVVILMISLINTIDTHYTRDVTVVSIQDQEITVEDSQGYSWCFYGDGYVVDQEITVVMYTNHTEKITDDEIVDVKAQGNN